jgi:hypothetical protein
MNLLCVLPKQTHMRPLLLLLLLLLTAFCLALLALASSAHAQKPAAKPTFTAQAPAILSGPWAQLYISAAGFSDDMRIYAYAAELKRDTPDGEISFKELSAKPAEFKPISAEQYRKLSAAVLASAAEVEQETTPGEILTSVSTEEAARLMKEGKLPSGWDVELFSLRSLSATGSVSAANGGHAKAFANYLEQDHSIKTRGYSRDEIRPSLGHGAFDGLE